MGHWPITKSRESSQGFAPTRLCGCLWMMWVVRLFLLMQIGWSRESKRAWLPNCGCDVWVEYLSFWTQARQFGVMLFFFMLTAKKSMSRVLELCATGLFIFLVRFIYWNSLDLQFEVPENLVATCKLVMYLRSWCGWALDCA